MNYYTSMSAFHSEANHENIMDLVIFSILHLHDLDGSKEVKENENEVGMRPGGKDI